MWLFPAAASVVSGYFAGQLVRGWAGRRKAHLLAWGIALAMFAAASLSAAVGMLWGWSELTFRSYYLFGAILNVPVLGLGTIYLMAPRRIAHPCAALVAVAAIYAAVVLLSAPLRSAGLDTVGIPRGSEVLSPGVRALSRYYSIPGFVIVIGGAVWSAVSLWRSRQVHLKRLAVANLLIAAGTTVVAVASEIARIANGSIEGSIFAIGLFIGVSLMFGGFRQTQRPRAT